MFEIVSILLKWLKPIALVTALAAILTAGLSLTMPNYYESVVVFYPANPALLDQSIFKKDGLEKPTFMFGTKVDLDRILSLGKSSELIGYAISKYKLFDHYKVDPNSSNADFKVGKKFKGNYKIQKNPEGAIELHMMDQSPEKAADWANDMAFKIDQMNRDIIFGKKEDQIAILETEVNNKQQQVRSLTDSINQLMRVNPQDTITLNIVKSFLKNTVEDLKTTQSKRDQNKAVINQAVETVYYFERAVPAKRKAKPARSIIVIASTLFTLFMMSLVAVFLEKYKEYKTES